MITHFINQSAAVKQVEGRQSQQYILTYLLTAGTSFQASQQPTVARVISPAQSVATVSQIQTIMTETSTAWLSTVLVNVSFNLSGVPLLYL